MTPKRRKPLLVNLTWVCVLVAPAVYFGSWLGLHWLYGRGVFDRQPISGCRLHVRSSGLTRSARRHEHQDDT